MRARLLASAAVTAVVLTGCNAPAEEPVKAAALPPVRIVEPPAASAGGACILWDYAFIDQMIGVRFTVAAGDRVDDTATCVVQTEHGPAPMLVLTVSDSSANAELFDEELVPAKATKVKGLGLAAYRLESKPAAGVGPTVEVGWLSEARQLQSLKFTFVKNTKAPAVKAMTTKLVAMARTMSSIEGKPAKKS